MIFASHSFVLFICCELRTKKNKYSPTRLMMECGVCSLHCTATYVCKYVQQQHCRYTTFVPWRNEFKLTQVKQFENAYVTSSAFFVLIGRHICKSEINFSTTENCVSFSSCLSIICIHQKSICPRKQFLFFSLNSLMLNDNLC